MTGKMSRRLVIDASVAQAAGGRDDITSKYCTDFLKEAKSICHRVSVSDDIEKEWELHKSLFFMRWWNAMAAADKVLEQGSARNRELRSRIKKLGLSPSREAKVLKDIHLIEMALISDQVVVSLDEEARKAFSQIADKVGSLKSICWVNPATSKDKPLAWLKSGARNEAPRRLGKKTKPSGP